MCSCRSSRSSEVSFTYQDVPGSPPAFPIIWEVEPGNEARTHCRFTVVLRYTQLDQYTLVCLAAYVDSNITASGLAHLCAVLSRCLHSSLFDCFSSATTLSTNKGIATGVASSKGKNWAQKLSHDRKSTTVQYGVNTGTQTHAMNTWLHNYTL